MTRDSCPEEGAAAREPEGQRSRAAGVESWSVSAFLEGRRTKKSPQALREGNSGRAHEFVPKGPTRKGGAGRKDSEKGA